MKTPSFVVMFVIMVFFISMSAAGADNATDVHALYRSDSKQAKAQAPPVKMLGKGVYELGGVVIKKKEGCVEFPAKVNMDKGVLEYALVGTGGKVHESLLATAIEPYSLQCALLLLGLKEASRHIAQQGDNAPLEGDQVGITVRPAGTDKAVAIEKWIDLRAVKKDAQINWIFTGSEVVDGTFRAQQEKSIIALYHDPAAMIDHRLIEGGNDEIWFVNEKKTPPAGTDVTVSICKIKETTGKKKTR